MGNANVKKFPIPPFSGNDIDKNPVERFVVYFENLSTDSKWTPEETAANAAKGLTENALLWYENLKLESPEIVKDWPSLKLKLLKRFSNFEADRKTVSEAASVEPFSGENETGYPVGRFITSIDDLAKTSGWTSKETALKATLALNDKAAVWLFNLSKESPEVYYSWALLKDKLQERFGSKLSIAERLKGLNSLHQKGKESSEDFYDRVSAQLFSLEQEILEAAKNEDERKAMIKMHHLFSSLFFVSGMELESKLLFLRDTIATQKVKFPSVEEIRLTAKSYDDLVKSKKKEAALKTAAKSASLTNSQQKSEQQIKSTMTAPTLQKGQTPQKDDLKAQIPTKGQIHQTDEQKVETPKKVEQKVAENVLQNDDKKGETPKKVEQKVETPKKVFEKVEIAKKVQQKVVTPNKIEKSAEPKKTRKKKRDKSVPRPVNQQPMLFPQVQAPQGPLHYTQQYPIDDAYPGRERAPIRGPRLAGFEGPYPRALSANIHFSVDHPRHQEARYYPNEPDPRGFNDREAFAQRDRYWYPSGYGGYGADGRGPPPAYNEGPF